MKLRPIQINKIEQMLNDLERKVEEMEQQDYTYKAYNHFYYELGKDLQNLSYMLDILREELKK